MVINTAKFLYYSGWDNESSIVKTGKADIVFVIDTTGSMREPIENVKKGIPAFVKDLEERNVNARFGLVTFKDIYQDGLDSTRNYGWYTSAEDSAVILDTQISKLANKGIETSIFTKTKLYSVYENAIKSSGVELANIHNGFATEAKPLSQRVGKKASGGCWIRLSNNTVVHLDKNPSLEDANVDSDKDGIPDSEELAISCKKRIYNPYAKKYEYMNVWTFNSNPAKKGYG